MNECVIEEIKMKHLEENYDIVVVGAGHAGCEAALAGARLGLSTIMFTVSAESIALMPCNPNVGGSSKGHLVRELDALGGEMGLYTARVWRTVFSTSSKVERSSNS